MKKICLLFIFCICFTGLYANDRAGSEWPCFHGTNRANKSTETGLLKEWPVGGPSTKWVVSGLGEGYSSVTVADGRIYTAGKSGDQSFVFCFDLKGNEIWKKPNGPSWSTTMSHARSYTGSRSTPTFDNGIVYHLGESGRLTAFDGKTGAEKWHRELMKDFDAETPEYGYAESVLIEGEHLYVRPAGKKGFQVCLNKNNGELIWSNTEIPGKEGYTSMVAADLGGYHQIIGASSNCYYGIDSKTGKLLWKVDFVNQRELNNTDAILHENYLFVSSGYGKGSMLHRLKPAGKGFIPEVVWQSAIMDNHHGGVILHEGHLYGAGSNSRGWFCLDFMTGEEKWKASGKGSVTFAENMLYLMDERGNMKLVKATPDKFEVCGEFNVPKGGEGMYWAHPVVCGGTLYLRHADKLYAYDIKRH